MPYITPKDRDEIDRAITAMPAAMSAGEIAYAVTKLILVQSTLDRESYAGLAQIIGVLETIKLEFQARLVEPYEAFKQKHNGDVF